MIEIKEVKSRSDLKKFIAFPFKLYRNNKYWVPPLLFDEINTLRSEKNPAFEYCEAKYWLAYKDGEIAGRIAGIINPRFNQNAGNSHARFGWVDFIDDIEVTKALIGAVEKWAQGKGLKHLHGPLGFSDLDHQGMLVEGFDEISMIITIYNYPYYPEHMNRLGFTKDTDWVEYEIKTPEEIPEKLMKMQDIIIKRTNIRIVDAKKSKDLLPYATGIFHLLNEAYKDLYGFAPLSDKQIKAYVKQYFGFVNPDYVRVILDSEDKIAAFGIAIPSLSVALQKSGGRVLPFGFIRILRALKKNDRLDLYLVAVRPDLQGKGINAILLNEINRTAFQNGIKFAETGPELEDNKKVQALWKYYETRQHKRRTCFIKEIDNSN